VDIKGIGGGVFGPGSLDGAYSIESWLPLTDWSGVGLELAAKRERKPLTYEPGWRPGNIFCDWTPSQAQRVLTDSLTEITDHIRTKGWADSGFRKLLLRKTRFFGGFVGTGYLDEADAYEQLANAIRAAGHEPDDDDVEIIESGLEVGAQDPVWVATKDPALVDDLPKDLPSEMSTEGFAAMLIDAADLDTLADPEPLIASWLYRDSTARLVGQPGSYKSFIALDMACCVALGRDWHGHAVKQTAVLYVVGEGLSGYKRRIAAWCEANGVEREELRGKLLLTRGSVQIGSAQWMALSAWVLAYGVGFLIGDTQAKMSVGSKESDNDAQGVVFASLDQLRQETSGTLLLLHHTGHPNGDAGERGRGASSWRAAVDTELLLTKTGDYVAVLRNDRQKEAESGAEVTVRMKSVSDSLVPELDASDIPMSARSEWLIKQVRSGVRFPSAKTLTDAVRGAGHKMSNLDKSLIFEEYHKIIAKYDVAQPENIFTQHDDAGPFS
jgi:hypothetical protein